MRRKFEEFMRGRYGADQFSRFLMSVCVALLLVNIITGRRNLYTLALVLLLYCYYRIFSKNYAKRSAENRKYLELTWKLRARLQNMSIGKWFSRTKKRIVQLRHYHIYKCPSCGQKIRIPRGKGRICITCPKCKTEFEKKS